MKQEEEIDRKKILSAAKQLDMALVSLKCLELHLEGALEDMKTVRGVKEYMSEMNARVEALRRGEYPWDD